MFSKKQASVKKPPTQLCILRSRHNQNFLRKMLV